MKNLQHKQQPKSKPINSFKVGLNSLPILATKYYSSSVGISYRSNILITSTITKIDITMKRRVSGFSVLQQYEYL